MSHISFPSIVQYRQVIKQVQDQCKYHSVPLPTLTFQGTVKLHGTNAGVVLLPNGEIQVQSRERVITPLDDNAGFAMFVQKNTVYFKRLLDAFLGYCDNDILSDKTSIQIYGEFCGGSIQKGIGLSYLPKKFIIFSVRISEDAASTEWLSPSTVSGIFDSIKAPEDIHLIMDFPTLYSSINFNTPEQYQNVLGDLTQAVEDDCPVARYFLKDSTDVLTGEGIVWECISEYDSEYNLPFTTKGLRFKVKGEKHSSSKVRTLAPIDTEKVNSINEFVGVVLTESRLNQGLDKLKEHNKELSERSTGDYIKWVVQDVLKEELDVVAASGWTAKDVTGVLAKGAREFYFKYLNSQAGLP
jgi:RNA ligase